MTKILLITDCKSRREISQIKTSLEEGGRHRVVVNGLKRAHSQLAHAHGIIIVWLDSVSRGQIMNKTIRESSRHKNTPIICWQPSTLVVKNVSIAYEPKSFPSMVQNVLAAKKEAEKKKVGPV
jgi:hypothetical protein